jgi:hypothetical protein
MSVSSWARISEWEEEAIWKTLLEDYAVVEDCGREVYGSGGKIEVETRVETRSKVFEGEVIWLGRDFR